MVPYFQLTGSAQARGLAHGQLCRDGIARMIEIYHRAFNASQRDVFDAARQIKTAIAAFRPDYASEIEAVALGAGVDPLWIYALNGRTELVAALAVPECTLVHFKGTPYVGQNWDWVDQLEDLIVVLEMTRPDGHKILTMTEPGIIGKIGLNSTGLGVCFNFLLSGRKELGVPVHILLRALLDATSLADARAQVDKAGFGKSSNFLVADASGQSFNVEFAGDRLFETPGAPTYAVHTNHYTGGTVDFVPEYQENSEARYDRACAIAQSIQTPSMDALETLLTDTQSPGNPIFRTYDDETFLGKIGTVCTIKMDLARREMLIRKGNDVSKGYQTFAV